MICNGLAIISKRSIWVGTKIRKSRRAGTKTSRNKAKIVAAILSRKTAKLGPVFTGLAGVLFVTTK